MNGSLYRDPKAERKRKMKFKRTVTLAILAAVLSANLVACVAEKDPGKDQNQTYTDENGNEQHGDVSDAGD